MEKAEEAQEKILHCITSRGGGKNNLLSSLVDFANKISIYYNIPYAESWEMAMEAFFSELDDENKKRSENQRQGDANDNT